jgi:hypothetical protein
MGHPGIDVVVDGTCDRETVLTPPSTPARRICLVSWESVSIRDKEKLQ